MSKKRNRYTTVMVSGTLRVQVMTNTDRKQNTKTHSVFSDSPPTLHTVKAHLFLVSKAQSTFSMTLNQTIITKRMIHI